MRILGKMLVASSGLLMSALSPLVMAEPYGLLNGRSANLSQMSDMSVEAGVVLGDLGDVDYEHFGVRLNYRLNPTVIAYGDLGKTDLASRLDGLAFGIGAFMQMDGIIQGSDFGIHGSVHRASLESSGVDVKVTALTLEAVFSGKDPMGVSGNMGWNAHLGLNRTSSSGNSETELMFGGGIVIKNASGAGEFYVGVLYVDDLAFGGGYRHYLN